MYLSALNVTSKSSTFYTNRLMLGKNAMASWPPLPTKNLINKTHGISVLQINHTGMG